MQKMLDEGIATRRGIMTTHRETAYLEESKDIRLPASEMASDRSIILPLFIPMTEAEQQKVISSFIKIIAG
jgi:dTDP-4-amino-4,6-dideoxygalactose transaminase